VLVVRRFHRVFHNRESIAFCNVPTASVQRLVPARLFRKNDWKNDSVSVFETVPKRDSFLNNARILGILPPANEHLGNCGDVGRFKIFSLFPEEDLPGGSAQVAGRP